MDCVIRDENTRGHEGSIAEDGVQSLSTLRLLDCRIWRTTSAVVRPSKSVQQVHDTARSPRMKRISFRVTSVIAGVSAYHGAVIRHVNCSICGNGISNGNDLVAVAHSGVLVRPYCAECYEKREGGRFYSRRAGVRLNSGQITWGLPTGLLMWVIVTVVMQGSGRLWLPAVFGGAFVWAGILRAYLCFKYKRNLLRRD